MKVLHVIAALAERYGGPSRNVIGLCAATRAAGTDAEICATDADGPRSSLCSRDRHPAATAAVPMRLFPRLWSERYKYSPALAHWLRQSVRNYDLLVVHGCFSHAPEAAAAIAVRAGVPYLLVPHGMLADWAFRRPGKRLYYRLRTLRMVRCASGFLCTSEAEQEEVVRRGGTAPSSRVAWGIEDELFSASPADSAAWKQSLSLSPQTRIILFLGRLHPKKGIVDQLLPALVHLPADVAAVIAGPTDAHAPGYEKLIREQTHRLGLESRVRLVGPLRNQAKIAALDCCDVFVLPSHSENFGSSVAEALARGRPVVVSDRVQIARDLNRAGGGLVAQLDPQDLLQALAELLSHPERARRIGEMGRRFAVEHFSWEAAATCAQRFYEEVVSTHPRGRR